MWPDMPWQLDVLVVETVVSALIGVALISRGFQRTLKTGAFFLTWNAALLALLITGGNDTTAHWVVAGLYLLDSATVVAASVKRKRSDPIEGILGTAIFATLWATMVASLIIAGAT